MTLLHSDLIGQVSYFTVVGYCSQLLPKSVNSFKAVYQYYYIQRHSKAFLIGWIKTDEVCIM